jgi:glycosyltransferase involved in cell wall biosynthesis
MDLLNISQQFEFVVLSFEGPDPYSMAGGLGVRVTQLANTLVSRGIKTHLIFIGDPERPGHEPLMHGQLILHRWCQWISRYHPLGVYDGEEDKLADYTTSIPPYVVEHIARNAAAQGKQLVILAEEWQTAETISRISDILEESHRRNEAILLWNANNTSGFHRIDWHRLAKCVTLTTVSRYMKQLMRPMGINPLVIPNGIPSDLLQMIDRTLVERIRSTLSGTNRPLLFKVGRFDPAKGWLTAIEASARLKALGYKVTLLCRGGIEPHGVEVLDHARELKLKVVDVLGNPETAEEVLFLIQQAKAGDIYHLKFPMAQEMLRPYYAAADAVLANSNHEPFGLVGLEAMAAGGVVFTGATGESYSESGEGAIALDTNDPAEIVHNLEKLFVRPDLAANLRSSAIKVAARFTWSEMVERLLDKLEFAAYTQQVSSISPAMWIDPKISRSILWQDQIQNRL